MLDFSLTEEQVEVRQLAQRIAVEHLRPQARESESRGDSSLPLWQTLGQTGLLTPFPTAYGGAGLLDALTHVLIAEELGYGDAALALNIYSSIMAPLWIILAGNEQQRDQYVPPFCTADTASRVRGSIAFAEHIGGYTSADIQTYARLTGSHYFLNGTKRAVIHGQTAYICIVLFRLENTNRFNGLGAAVLPEKFVSMQTLQDEQK